MNRSTPSGDGSGQRGYREQMGRWMIVGAWLLLLALLTLFFSQWMARQNNPNQGIGNVETRSIQRQYRDEHAEGE